MFERLILLGVLIIAGCIAYKVFAMWQMRRADRLVSAVDPLLSDLRKGTPAVLLFTTPFCVPCKMVQIPALERLQQEMGERLQVIQIDACERPEDADRWGVLSAPTTFILDGSGTTRSVNHGVADYPQLKRQILTVSG